MKKKKNKKILKFLGVIIIIGILVYLVVNMKIKNIYIKGNNLLTDQEIIELAKYKIYLYNLLKVLKNHRLSRL